jgi:hypothetical protein
MVRRTGGGGDCRPLQHFSELQLHRDLQNAWVPCAGKLSKVGAVHGSNRRVEVSVVYGIKGLQTRLEFELLRYREQSAQSRVEVELAGTA